MRRFRPLTMLLIPLLCLACSEDEATPLAPGSSTLNVPEDYASINAAVAVAKAGDKVVVSYRPQAYAEVIVLPADVTLMGNVNNNELPLIEGGITVSGSGRDTKIEGLKISNPIGAGLILSGSVNKVSQCWFFDCQEAGLKLVGPSPAIVVSCDFENCAPGVMIRDLSSGGDYADSTAASITDCNFIGNTGAPAKHLVFANVTAPSKVKVNANHWEREAGELVDDTIWDSKDDSGIRGTADTTYDGFLTFPDPIPHYWND